MLLSWTVRVHRHVSVDPHDNHPWFFICDREARNIGALPQLLPLDRFDPGTKSSRPGPDHLWEGAIQRERWHQPSQGIRRTEGDDQEVWGCKDASSLVRPFVILTTATQYYKLAINTPVGMHVSKFYTQTAKHVHDIHEEASRLAGWQKTNVVESPADAESSTT